MGLAIAVIVIVADLIKGIEIAIVHRPAHESGIRLEGPIAEDGHLKVTHQANRFFSVAVLRPQEAAKARLHPVLPLLFDLGRGVDRVGGIARNAQSVIAGLGEQALQVLGIRCHRVAVRTLGLACEQIKAALRVDIRRPAQAID